MLALDYKISSVVTPIRVISSSQIPYPYKKLLMQRRYMTLILEEYAHTKLRLKVLQQHIDNQLLSRSIVLVSDNAARVLFAEIEVNLPALPQNLQTALIDRQLPLGYLLNRDGIIENFSRIEYFKVMCNTALASYFSCQSGCYLFGRLSYLQNQQGVFLAKSTEVLPP